MQFSSLFNLHLFSFKDATLSYCSDAKRLKRYKLSTFSQSDDSVYKQSKID